MKKFLAFYGIPEFTALSQQIRHRLLTTYNQSTLSQPAFVISTLLLYSHRHLGLASGLRLSGLPTKTLHFSPPEATILKITPQLLQYRPTFFLIRRHCARLINFDTSLTDIS
jgi:hypothetical protein